MPTPTKGPRLGGSPAHERLMLANLATALFEHGRITTTHAKAKRLRPLAERLITAARRGDLHARRRVLTVVRDKGVVHTLVAEIGPRFAERPGGYTRITKLGPRKGDNAPMAMIELVEARTVAQQAVGEAERARSSRFRLPRRPGTSGTGSIAVPAGEAADTGVEPGTAVPTEGDTDGTPAQTTAPTPVPTDGGDEEVAIAQVGHPVDAISDGAGQDAGSVEIESAGSEPPVDGRDDESAQGSPS